MEEDLRNLAFVLKELIEKDPRVLSLLKSEKDLSSNAQVLELTHQLTQIENEYRQASNFAPVHDYSLLPIQKRLFLAKQKLDLEPLVIIYKKNYQSVRLLYENINAELFDVFNQHACEVSK